MPPKRKRASAGNVRVQPAAKRGRGGSAGVRGRAQSTRGRVRRVTPEKISDPPPTLPSNNGNAGDLSPRTSPRPSPERERPGNSAHQESSQQGSQNAALGYDLAPRFANLVATIPWK